VRVFRQRSTLGGMPLVPTPARLKLLQACNQCHSSRVPTFLTSPHRQLHPNTEGTKGNLCRLTLLGSRCLFNLTWYGARVLYGILDTRGVELDHTLVAGLKPCLARDSVACLCAVSYLTVATTASVTCI
jgi:hypothetical protein